MLKSILSIGYDNYLLPTTLDLGELDTVMKFFQKLQRIDIKDKYGEVATYKVVGPGLPMTFQLREAVEEDTKKQAEKDAIEAGTKMAVVEG